jgi:hypothetical protein
LLVTALTSLCALRICHRRTPCFCHLSNHLHTHSPTHPLVHLVLRIPACLPDCHHRTRLACASSHTLCFSMCRHFHREGALSEGFACVQMARALIRQPDFVRRVELSHASGSGGHNSDAGADIVSPCTHCNQCVVATLDIHRPVECPERRRDGIADSSGW